MYAKAAGQPATLAVLPDNIPAELRQRDRWVCWRWKNREGKWTKPPYQARNGRLADSTDPATWTAFEVALAAYRRGSYAGIGIALGGEVGIDLDKCRDPRTGELKPWASEIIEQLGTYGEASPSATGARLIGRGRPLDKGIKRPYHDGVVEVYDRGRYLTMTGHRFSGSPTTIADLGDNLDWLLNLIAPPDEKKPPRQPSPPDAASLDDQQLLDTAFGAVNGAAIRALWNGDTSGHDSHSEADLALCNHLAFYTGKDAARMDSLFRQSGLYRDKWEREDYRGWTINKAIDGCTDVYTGQGPRLIIGRPDPEPPPPLTPNALWTFLLDGLSPEVARTLLTKLQEVGHVPTDHL